MQLSSLDQMTYPLPAGDLLNRVPFGSFRTRSVLKTDASGTGIGAASEQEQDGQIFPIAFYSWKLTPAETRYAATELEALAIIKVIRHFQVYLKGARFVIETDHRALTFIRSMKCGSPKLMRWATLLQEHNCHITYRPGSANAVADAQHLKFQ